MVKKWLIFMCRFVPPIFLVLIPGMAIYDTISPWEVAAVPLKEYSDSYTLLIGGSSRYYLSNGKKHWRKEKTYLVVDPALTSSTTIDISADSKGHVEVDKRAGGLLKIVVYYLSLIVLTWFSWFGYRYFAHNNAPKRDAANGGRAP